MSFLSALAPALGAVVGNMIVPGAGGLIGGALVGSGVSSAVSQDEAIKAQDSANRQNIEYSQATNATEIELANTAHQREVADLKAAGLNPILSARLGGSATPSLTSPQMQSLAPIIQSSAKQAQDSVGSYAQMGTQFQLQKSQVELNNALKVKANAEANYSNTSAIGQALDNYRKGKELPLHVTAAANRQFEEESRQRRWPWLKSLGVGVKDYEDTILHGVSASVGNFIK